MSELENIARDIVQHEEERQAEKIKLESEIKGLEEVLEHGISTKFVEEEVIYVYSPKTAHEMREKLEENYKQFHAQLTIPKSVAEMLDKRWEAQNKYLQRKVTVPRDALYNAVNPYDNQLAATKIGKWIDENQNICFVYLAGKALGVDLVKVVEG
ncbi:hypothetical protein [Lactococcus lactis]|uniref:hypothetical protein n=1 Tax=Lactococcus lactis TaxID=1358 RepID=UPI00071C3B17|nr:hypothetical protein [Lactococcus lactis]KST92518.1 Phage protein [Lactococcus lactis subsp. lactis]